MSSHHRGERELLCVCMSGYQTHTQHTCHRISLRCCPDKNQECMATEFLLVFSDFIKLQEVRGKLILHSTAVFCVAILYRCRDTKYQIKKTRGFAARTAIRKQSKRNITSKPSTHSLMKVPHDYSTFCDQLECGD